MTRTVSLIIRNLLFTLVVPGLGGVWAPWWILTRAGRAASPAAWEAVPVIAAGAALYAWCVWISYEERTLRRRFGNSYLEYRRTVPRWIPRPPRPG